MKKLEIFFFRYFSQETFGNKDGWVRNVVAIIMFIPFLTAFTLTVIGKNAKIPTYIFMGLLVPFAVLWIIVWFYHNYRIKHKN
jgi:hypothetical protein